ncbi:MAG TPA: hypothetical protein VNU26_01220 [Mycobacteriales bacterium]|nr:hypothetical protein [Mycobacteriales bacterium]
MKPPTTAPRAKKALHTMLAAAMPGVQVVRGHPGDTIEDELVQVGRVRAGRQEWAALAADKRPRDEHYSIEVYIQVLGPGRPQDEVTERAYELMALVDQQLRNDPTLGGTVRSCQLSDFEDDETPYEEGRAATVTVQVRCNARTRREQP